MISLLPLHPPCFEPVVSAPCIWGCCCLACIQPWLQLLAARQPAHYIGYLPLGSGLKFTQRILLLLLCVCIRIYTKDCSTVTQGKLRANHRYALFRYLAPLWLSTCLRSASTDLSPCWQFVSSRPLWDCPVDKDAGPVDKAAGPSLGGWVRAGGANARRRFHG